MPRGVMLTGAGLRRERMAAQLLHRPRRMRPPGVVRHLLGVQAQVLSAAGQALAVRAEGLTAPSVERARAEDRSIVLTWAMRGTLHLIAAEDCGWLLPVVTEPRVANARRRLRELGLTGDRQSRAVRAVERMLEREGPLTRQEVLGKLRRRGFGTADEAVAYHVLWLTAAAGGVCYGPMRGRDRCFVLVRDWVGRLKSMDRHSSLAELALRYLAAHGPAAPVDLAFWAGIGMANAKRAWGAIGERLVEVKGPSATLWAPRSRPEPAKRDIVRLLPNFDEYLLGWKDRQFIAPREQWKQINRGGGWLHPVVLVDGRAAATWRGERSPGRLRIDVSPFGSLSPAVRGRISVEARAVAGFLGTSPDVRIP